MRKMTAYTMTATLLLLGCGGKSGTADAGVVDSVDAVEETSGRTDTTPDAMTADDIGVDIQLRTDTGPDTTPEDAVFSEIADAQDGGEDVQPDLPPPFEPAVCGLEPYQWLPPSEVGEPLFWEEYQLSGLTAEFVNSTLATMGYELLNPVPYGARNFKMRYTTQDKGQPREATGAVGIPVGMGDGPLPVVLWLHPTVGYNDSAAPSADPLLGPGQTSVLSSLGYISVAPDGLGIIGFGDPSPEGTIHPYLVGEPTAIAGLDMVRAVLDQLAADPDLPDGDPNRIILWGASQGGHAVFFTELYAPHYAPEFEVVAAAAAIPGTDLTAQAAHGVQHWSVTTEILVAVMVAMKTWYDLPALTEVLADDPPNHLASEAENAVANTDSPGYLMDGLDEPSQIYTAAFIEALVSGVWGELEPWGCALRENSLDGSSVERVSDTPILATLGEHDDLAQTYVELEAMIRYCEHGYRIEYFVCAGLDHVMAGAASLYYMHHWTQDRLKGKPWEEAAICAPSAPVDCLVP